MNSLFRKYGTEILLFGICSIALSLLVWGLTWRIFWLSYKIFVPPISPMKPVPALIVLHGRSGSGTDMQQWLGFDEFAQEHGLMVVYPNSKYTGWDFGVGIAERGQTGRLFIDHSRYINNIMDRIDRTHPIDWQRVYIIGISDGASMAMRFSCNSDRNIGGLVSVAATIAFYSVTDCGQAQPVPVMLMHGTDD